MTYETNIPRMVGLSGSSAIITAAFRALLRFYRLSITDDLKIDEASLPQVILDVEMKELGITAGLQDRVIQVERETSSYAHAHSCVLCLHLRSLRFTGIRTISHDYYCCALCSRVTMFGHGHWVCMG